MNKWIPAEATIDVAGKLVNIKAPSKIQLRGGLNHLCHERLRGFLSGAQNIRDIKYIVDVGANIGATALALYNAFPKARILALEPVKLNWDCLVHNTKDIPTITARKIAAGRERGYVDLALPDRAQRPDIDSDLEGNSGLFSMFGKGTQSETVPIDTLDNIADSKVDILKIDVEGAEAEVLAGAKRIIMEDRPIIIIELRKTNITMGGHTTEEYEGYFNAIRYGKIGMYVGDHIFCPTELDHLPWNRSIPESPPAMGVECAS
jgi:FkbM family methyltransferase